jgi:uncharacterized protein YndB with AHSA1/START domain
MDDIVIEQTYPYSAEQVWEALTDPAALADWLMPGDFKPVVGHKFRWEGCEPRPEFDGNVDVVILEVNKPRQLSYSWKTSDMLTPTTVTFTLTPIAAGKTKLKLVHAGFTDANGKRTHPLFKGGWVEKLGKQLPDAIEHLTSRR